MLNTRQVKVAISDNSFAFSVLCRQFLERTPLGLSGPQAAGLRPRLQKRSGSSWLITFKIPWGGQKFAFQFGELPVDFFVRKFGTVRCVFEP